jgi:hypothetical protein
MIPHATVLGMAIPEAEVAKELAKVIVVPWWSPSPSPDGQESYEAANSAPSGEQSTWHSLNHDHSRPLDRLTLPLKGRDRPEPWRGSSHWKTWNGCSGSLGPARTTHSPGGGWAGRNTRQEQTGSGTSRPALNDRIILMEISHQVVIPLKWFL